MITNSMTKNAASKKDEIAPDAKTNSVMITLMNGT